MKIQFKKLFMTTTEVKRKWFYDAQKVSEKWLTANSEDYQCNWQQVGKNIVVECFSLSPGLRQVIFCYYKNTGTITMFNGANWARKF